MKTLAHVLTRGSVLLALAAAVFIAGCGLDKSGIDPITGPSTPAEFALSVTLTATPDQLPRDGATQSTITVLVRDAQGRPVNDRLLNVTSSVGSVSPSDLMTKADGSATFTLTAPPFGTVGNTAVVSVIPASKNGDTPVARTVSIFLTGGSNSTAPMPSFTVDPEAPVLKESVVFDASATTDEGATCRDVCTYSWDFGGESTGSGRVVTYRFQAIRTYPVKLTVTDSAGSSATLTTNVAVSQGTAPTASFSFSPTSPGQFETVRFTAEASRVGVAGRTITSYEWKFGNGGNATGVTASTTYSVLGTYPVTLTVTDSAGIQATTSQNVAVVSGVTADFTMSPTNPSPGGFVIFNAEASKGSDGFGGRNSIESYIWNFGVTTDNVTKSDPRTCTTFPEAKTYTINLTVVDSAGRRGTTSKTLAVTAGSSTGCP